jgi:hypothetical protein
LPPHKNTRGQAGFGTRDVAVDQASIGIVVGEPGLGSVDYSEVEEPSGSAATTFEVHVFSQSGFIAARRNWFLHDVRSILAGRRVPALGLASRG